MLKTTIELTYSKLVLFMNSIFGKKKDPTNQNQNQIMEDIYIFTNKKRPYPS